MYFLPTVGKGRKPRFELHLKIYDLNNVPLVSGNSFIKWHLAHSMHADHRGRTIKCPIENHTVNYNFSKMVPSIRISIDKNNQLHDCPLEFEIVQEFAVAEKITLGYVRLNLAEYVEESETYAKDVTSPPPPRRRSSTNSISPTADIPAEPRVVEDGIVRRYLMQDSKVNSTLKIGILMVQIDGERNFVAPTLKSAPVFGGIAGLVAPEQVEADAGPLPNIAKGRDLAEVQDLYRRTLAASWTRFPSELPADECIEDIFSGGNGWKTRTDSNNQADTDDEDDEGELGQDTIRPSQFRRLALYNQSHHSRRSSRHQRNQSSSSEKSVSTVMGRGPGSVGPGSTISAARRAARIAPRDDGRNDDAASLRSGKSLGSLAPTQGSSSDGEREVGMRRVKELPESDLRDDLVAWKLPGVTT
ncbi:respiratory complex assembly protein Rmp1 [Drechmeria coniospora]|uniref:Respiratory complex assembly protein Rmp1 n=1 Tax=Drechmeria coniospora TaxID=98403 RepID=A0A151GS05_DRECN|nr:respiratory complex assembly protein Rmp1 [Drechmeria coniospora]KYK59887.1 respiratory complex assembly protein Rmp1 [Drechmeria coniospora]ODA78683.1 hypothetical protein RJ55_06065 [Drechmeria coniospora]